ncbi:MAG: DNA cytosine methyltransferase [Christensenellales bacterium]
MKQGFFVDNFAGGGGASTGIEFAIGRSVDVAINHDPDAIAMHRANHPTTKHYCEDVWEIDPIEVSEGKEVTLAWFSPDCKHFSRAKGGKPVDKSIRGLAWVAIKWALLVRPKVIMLENVPEIQTWGPLDENNRPIKELAGSTFQAFIGVLTNGVSKNHPAFSEMCSALEYSIDSPQADILKHGLRYTVEYRTLKSCDYGAPTSRTRFYLIAKSEDEPIIWPEPTHASKDSEEVRMGRKLPYRTVSECIDWSIPVQSIFDRDKPLAENTLSRIAKGIKKFVIDNPNPFIVPMNEKSVAPSLIQYHTETTDNEVRGQALNEPLMTLDTSNRYALSCAYLVTLRNNMIGQALDEPLSTVSCSGAHHAEIRAFLIKYFSNGTAKPVDEPLDTITTKDRFAVVTVKGEDYVIADIGMRMLQPRELFNAQGFPADYIIDHDADGNIYPKAKQVARCGNAVTPPVPAALVRANLPEYCNGDRLRRGCV